MIKQVIKACVLFHQALPRVKTINCQDFSSSDSLTTTQWKHLAAIQDLLHYSHLDNIPTSQVQTEHNTTIAMVVPVLKELNLHLQEAFKTIGVGAVSKKMSIGDLNMLQIQKQITLIPFMWHQHYYINPSYRRRLMESKQVNEAKQFLLKLMVSNNSQGIRILQNLNIEHEKSVN